jgi:regulator of sigma E protease
VQLIREWLVNGWAVVLVLLGLGLIIFIHELGHFLMAKKNKVKVEIFSLGFGPAIWKIRRGETEYRISWFPLGGYVKMAGETLGDERRGEPWELTSKTPWQRFQIFVAGATMNLLIAFPIGLLCYMVGKYEHSNEVGVPGVAETKAGMRPGDIVVEVDGRKIDSLDKFRIEMIRRPTGVDVPVKVMRAGQEVMLKIHTQKSPYHQTLPATEMLTEVRAGSPLALQGIKEGDELVRVNDLPVTSGQKADSILRESPGREVSLRFRRRQPDFQDQEGIAATLQLAPMEWWSIPQDDSLLECRVQMVSSGMPAFEALEPDDVIKRVSGKLIGNREIKCWQDLKDAVEPSCNEEIELEVLREKDSKTLNVKITPTYNQTQSGLGGIGISPKQSEVFAQVRPGSYYDKAGLKSGDVLYSLAGRTGELKIGSIFRRERASVRSPGAGKVVKVNVTAGATVKADEVVAIVGGVETEYRVVAPRDGVVQAVLCKEGDAVEPDGVLVMLKPLSVTLQVKRAGESKPIEIKLDAEKKLEGDLAAAGFKTNPLGYLLLADSNPYRKRPFGDAVKAGLWEPYDLAVMTFDVLRKLVTHEESPKGLSGPLGIFSASYQFAKKSFGNFIWLLCLITVNLGIFNLLPIPVLDGGHNVLLLIEVVRKKLGKSPPSDRFVANFQYAGLFFILALFLFVTYQDISRMFGHG